MTELLFTAISFTLMASIILFLFIYWVKKKKGHNDFMLVSILLGIFFLVAVFASYYSITDAFEVEFDDIAVKNGECEIVYLENIGGRFGEPDNLVQITVEGITAEGKLGKFPNIKQGTFACEIEYTKTTQMLLNVERNQES